MESIFRFKKFSVRNEASALKIGTDAVVLGTTMTLKPDDKRLLDIGTGTGVIALIAAQRLSEAGADFKIEGIDIDAPSAAEAELNFHDSPWSGSLTAMCRALQDYASEEPFDCIFSNPPYFENSLKNPDAGKMLARHTDALSFQDICKFASGHLGKNGRLSIILPFDSAASFRRIAASFGLSVFRTVSVKTTPAKPPKRIILEFTKVRSHIVEETLTLQNGNERSLEFRTITENFYL